MLWVGARGKEAKWQESLHIKKQKCCQLNGNKTGKLLAIKKKNINKKNKEKIKKLATQQLKINKSTKSVGCCDMQRLEIKSAFNCVIDICWERPLWPQS